MFATLGPHAAQACPALRLPCPALGYGSGFIRKLPPALIQAFRATLEEVTEASLIIHVADATSEEMRSHMEEVDRVLKELGASKTPQILALNKCDLLEPQQAALRVQREQAAASCEAVVDISARTGQGLERLASAVDSILSKGAFVRRRLLVPYDKGGALSMVYQRGRILERRDGEAGIEVVGGVGANPGRAVGTLTPAKKPIDAELAIPGTRDGGRRPQPSSVQRRQPIPPWTRGLELSGQAEQRALVPKPAHELHSDGQTVRRPMQGDRGGWLTRAVG